MADTAEPLAPETPIAETSASDTSASGASSSEAAPEAAVPATRLRVTDAAHEALGRMIEDAGLSADGGVRLSGYTGAGCSAPLRYDMALEAAPDADDVVLEREGVRIFMDPESAWILDGLLVDYVTDSPMGEGFAFRHPNGPNGRSC